MNNKKNYGQFMTTNYQYILQGLLIPENVKHIIEPFCGNGDLLNFLQKDYTKECYDIEPKHNYIIQKDTLNNPPDFNNKFILTNPPYLARNKSDNKYLFNKYNTNDLYKCFIKIIIESNPIGGILIIPLNFWSSIRSSDIQLRKNFINKFSIIRLNIFEETVFDDTSYTICSFQFSNKNNNNIPIFIFPSLKKININLSQENNFTIGGEIYNLQTNNNIYHVSRITNSNKNQKNNYTQILAKCIDDNANNLINLSFDKNIIIDNTPNASNRTYATLLISPPIDENKQKWLIQEFNKFLNDYRNKYNSLFLNNYRESKDIARKRISFQLIYQICSFILNK